MSHTAADVTKIVSKIRFEVGDRRRLRNIQGSIGRHEKIRQTVTALFKHERIELNYDRGDECRGYAERLISEAIRYGDCHKETMEMADYWLKEKPLVHKLFKVLVPRYQDSPVSYTRMIKAPKFYPGQRYDRVVLELRNNIYPPLTVENANNRNYLHNVLLDEARKVFRKEKYAQMAENLAAPELDNTNDITEQVEDLTLNSDDKRNETSQT